MQTGCIEPDNARVFRGANHQNPTGENQSIAFNSIMISATEHARREAGLPGRVDRERSCASCTDALPRRSIDWQGHLGVPTTRYGCKGMPCGPERENWRGRC